MKIAVDAMGGDRAPGEILHGVAVALERGYLQPDEIVLVGDRERLDPLVRELALPAAVEIRHASQVVEMGESVARSLRGKPDSSIQVALRLLKDGVAGAMLSAGNTGAVVACGLGVLGRLPGVKRPGIAVTLASAAGPVIFLDVGANVHCKPIHLFQYGLMASIISRDVFQVAEPRIGLLNIGEEEGKGNELVRRTRELFARSDLNFVGNVEGTDILSGRCHVIVCEGFVGNVVLKVAEGIGVFLRASVKEQLRGEEPDSPLARALYSVTAKLDYAEYGGAPLLGVNGLVMIMHGCSDRRATASALRVSRRYVDSSVHEHIKRAIGGAESSSPAAGELG